MPGPLSEWYARRGRGYITTEPVAWEIGTKGSGLLLRVPAGFLFDVSIPAFLRWAFNPADPRYLKAAALHDYALSLGWGRVSAAAPFSEALRAAGVSRTRRLAMVLAVTIHKWS